MQRSAALASLVLFVACCVPTFEDLLPTAVLLATLFVLGAGAAWFYFGGDDREAR